MGEVEVFDVVFALEQQNVHVDSALRRRVEWAIGEGNYEVSFDDLRYKLTEFIMSRKHSFRPTSTLSIDDLLCQEGVPLNTYQQFRRLLVTSTNIVSMLTPDVLKSLDHDSSIVTLAQNHPEQVSIFQALRDLGLTHTQCRVIFGLGTQSYERLKRQVKEQAKDDIGRRGRSADDAWSFAKHVINEECVRLLHEEKGSTLFVLETHQGIGDASIRYQHYGHVLGFEKHPEAHRAIRERVQQHGIYRNARDLYLRQNLYAKHNGAQNANTLVFVPEQPTACEQGLTLLINQGIRFDVVDIDPFASSQPFFTDAIKVLSDPGLVMLTIGDQQPWPKAEAQAWERYDAEMYSTIISQELKREWRQKWMFLRLASAWYMRTAARFSLCMLPIVVLRSLEPWVPRDDFPHGVMGIDRVYFLAKHVSNPNKIEAVVQAWTEPLRFFDKPILRTHVSAYNRPQGDISFISFSDEIWPAMKGVWMLYHDWLATTASDVATRWSEPQPPKVKAARDQVHAAVKQACQEKLRAGYYLANNWLRTV